MPRRDDERARERWAGRRVSECSEVEIRLARDAGYEPAGTEGGSHFVGRDPRQLSASDLLSMGHEQLSPLEAIRAKCLDCCAGSPHEVRLCVAVACVSWPFRMGRSPWRAKPTDEQRQALQERGKALAASQRR